MYIQVKEPFFLGPLIPFVVLAYLKTKKGRILRTKGGLLKYGNNSFGECYVCVPFAVLAYLKLL